MELRKFIATTIREYLNEQQMMKESWYHGTPDAREIEKVGGFGFGEFPKPKTEIWIQLMNRALKDGLISQIHYGDKRIKRIAIELADEFEKMEEWNRQSNKDLFLGLFYDRIPRWAWGEPTNSILMKYNLKKS